MTEEELKTLVINRRDQANAGLVEIFPELDALVGKDFSEMTERERNLVLMAWATMMGNLHSGYWSLDE